MGGLLLGSANAETTPARAPAAAADRTQRPDANMRREEGVTVQGPVKEQQPNGLSHGEGGGHGCGFGFVSGGLGWRNGRA